MKHDESKVYDVSQAWTRRADPTRLRTSERRSHWNDHDNISSPPSRGRLADERRNRS